jgi:hypothetical protein
VLHARAVGRAVGDDDPEPVRAQREPELDLGAGVQDCVRDELVDDEHGVVAVAVGVPARERAAEEDPGQGRRLEQRLERAPGVLGTWPGGRELEGIRQPVHARDAGGRGVEERPPADDDEQRARPRGHPRRDGRRDAAERGCGPCRGKVADDDVVPSAKACSRTVCSLSASLGVITSASSPRRR